MLEILSQTKPDVVFHLASCFLARHDSNDLDRLVDSNLRFGLQLLEAMAKAGCRHLINTGTGWQHFQNREDDPVCLYAATKTAFESLVQYYVSVEGFSVVTLKLHDTYGPHDPRGKLIALLLNSARNGQPLDLSPGEQKIDLVHVDDVVSAFQCADTHLRSMTPGSHEQFMVSSGSPLSIKELVEKIEAATGFKIAANWGARSYRDREVMVPWNRGPLVPGWKPVIKLETGIQGLWEQ
jgi:nucleoside-diphosphate-sugar epimerase